MCLLTIRHEWSSIYTPPSLDQFTLVFEVGGGSGGSLADINIFRQVARGRRGGGLMSILNGIAKKKSPLSLFVM